MSGCGPLPPNAVSIWSICGAFHTHFRAASARGFPLRGLWCPTRELFAAPRHPYTKALLSAIPSLDPDNRGNKLKLEGEIPSPTNPPPGCKFHTRCPYAIDICKTEEPELTHSGMEHDVACHRWEELAEEDA